MNSIFDKSENQLSIFRGKDGLYLSVCVSEVQVFSLSMPFKKTPGKHFISKDNRKETFYLAS